MIRVFALILRFYLGLGTSSDSLDIGVRIRVCLNCYPFFVVFGMLTLPFGFSY